jgi:hypothetical protein
MDVMIGVRDTSDEIQQSESDRILVYSNHWLGKSPLIEYSPLGSGQFPTLDLRQYSCSIP